MTVEDLALVLKHKFGHHITDEDVKAAHDKEEAEKPKSEALEGSSSEKYGASDWTAAGQDEEGFPVAKDSPEDVTEHGE